MLRDLESLQFDVVDERVRPLVTEVVRAYEAGAMRSATVSLWIAVFTDLIFKIRHLSESGDGEARVHNDKLYAAIETKNVKQLQQHERNLLKTVSEDLEMLSSREADELQRLYDDRNLCAHPGFLSDTEIFQPDSEAVRAHLVAACRITFSQRPLVGKRLIETLDRELYSDSWPDQNTEDLREYLLNRFFRRMRNSGQENLLKVLFKDSVKTKSDNGKTNFENARATERARNALHALVNDFPLVLERISSSVFNNWEDNGSLTDEILARATGNFGQFPSFWENLPKTARTRLVTILQQGDISVLLHEGLFSCGTPSDEEIKKLFEEAIADLKSQDLDLAIHQATNRSIFIPAALDWTQASHSFRNAEFNLSILSACSKDLSPSDIISLKDAIEANEYEQVRLAGGTENILIGMFSETPKTDEHHEAWKELACFLYAAGNDKSQNNFLYESLCEAVGIHTTPTSNVPPF